MVSRLVPHYLITIGEVKVIVLLDEEPTLSDRGRLEVWNVGFLGGSESHAHRPGAGEVLEMLDDQGLLVSDKEEQLAASAGNARGGG